MFCSGVTLFIYTINNILLTNGTFSVLLGHDEGFKVSECPVAVCVGQVINKGKGCYALSTAIKSSN